MFVNLLSKIPKVDFSGKKYSDPCSDNRLTVISNIFFGGEKQTIRGFQNRCETITRMRGEFHPRILRVDVPNQKALESIHREVSVSTVKTFRSIQ